MMYWIYDYPSWAIAILFVAVFIAVTWIGIFLTRATVHSWIHRETRANEMVGFALSSFFVLFGLLLGLVTIATNQNYSNVADTVDKEASSIAALDRDFNGFPPPVRGQLQDRRRLGGDEFHRWALHRLGNCFRVPKVVLLRRPRPALR